MYFVNVRSCIHAICLSNSAVCRSNYWSWEGLLSEFGKENTRREMQIPRSRIEMQGRLLLVVVPECSTHCLSFVFGTSGFAAFLYVRYIVVLYLWRNLLTLTCAPGFAGRWCQGSRTLCAEPDKQSHAGESYDGDGTAATDSISFHNTSVIRCRPPPVWQVINLINPAIC